MVNTMAKMSKPAPAADRARKQAVAVGAISLGKFTEHALSDPL